jgi:hypothetical protein
MPPRLPDFIIGGAMKCATTSLHHILGSHPGVFLPPGEIKLFDIDEITLHPDNFPYVAGRWTDHEFEQRSTDYLEWYRQQFAAAPAGALIGEDSPSYLASLKAPARVHRLLPNVKWIFLLRDPVARAYSHCWHLVRTRRTSGSFEETLRQDGSLLQRGFYRESLQRYLNVFAAAQIRVILFEQFVAETGRVVGQLLDFLGVDPTAPVDLARHNESRFPRFVGLRLLENRCTRYLAGRRHWSRPGMPGPRRLNVLERAVLNLGAWLNPLRRGRPQPMRPGTEQFLSRLYQRENAGLSELIGLPVEEYWPSCQHSRL